LQGVKKAISKEHSPALEKRCSSKKLAKGSVPSGEEERNPQDPRLRLKRLAEKRLRRDAKKRAFITTPSEKLSGLEYPDDASFHRKRER